MNKSKQLSRLDKINNQYLYTLAPLYMAAGVINMIRLVTEQILIYNLYLNNRIKL